MKRIFAVYLVFLGAFCVPSMAEPVDKLLQALAGFEQMQGEFVQVQYTPGDEVLSESSGRFQLLKPSYFTWEIESPDSQLIISDPQYLWHHDRDLETVTRRPVAGNAQLSPLQVLAGDDEALRNHYRVSESGNGAYTLTPTDVSPGFNSVTVELVDGQIAALQILDNLQQRVSVVFSSVDVDSVLTSADFEFVPPEGADVFHYDK